MNQFIVTVLIGYSYMVARILDRMLYTKVHDEGYVEGSTCQSYHITTKFDADEIQEAIWAELPQIYCSVRDPYKE